MVCRWSGCWVPAALWRGVKGGWEGAPRRSSGRAEGGQSSVEAAALLPTLVLLLGLLLQPACLLYTRAVMHGAAAEAARVMVTLDGGEEDCREFVLRRLEAVPEVPLFHVGGRTDWQVSLEQSGTKVSVAITGHVRPLPLLGVTARALGRSDATGVVVEVSVSEEMRPAWFGGSYESWVQMWG